MAEPDRELTRRGFLGAGLATALGITCAGPIALAGAQPTDPSAIPWYRRAFLWGQTNITEKDPVRYDIAWWRAYWKRTQVQAVIINAGGIVAYYPSRFPLHHRAEFLGDRDLFGELTKAAHEDGLFVMARMDSNRTAEDFFKAHPGLVRARPRRPAVPRRRQVRHLHQQPVLRRVPARRAARDHRALAPGRVHRQQLGGPRPRRASATARTAPARSRRNAGSARCRGRPTGTTRSTERGSSGTTRAASRSGRLNNRVTRAAGGPDCIWSGMISGSITAQARSFRDLRAICARADIIMLDHQRRDDDTGFQQNGDTGKRVHGCSAGTSWRPSRWRCTSRAPATTASRASRRPRRACG